MKKLSFALLLLLTVISCREERYPAALSPEESLKRIAVRAGFSVTLFAHEPHVKDPVEMVFDENGNAFVAEMPDYPYMPEEKGAGRIRLLQDLNRDGVIDNSVVFADSILEATSMLPWKGGLIVTAAPHILYLRDIDGDFKADEREVLFTGFFDKNSEAQITSLRFGIDNWIYAANNGQAGSVRFTRRPEAAPLEMAGGDFRFRLDRNEFELESGAAQFGQTIDDWGNRFITQNTLHIRQVMIPRRYLMRNEVSPPGNVQTNISDHDLEMFQLTPPPYWRAERTARRQKQYKDENLDRVEYAEDHFTGCSGGTIYDGHAFPDEYYGSVFTGDVAGNLVHRDILIPAKDSPVFIARRGQGEKEKEFLASTDSWFRPASFTVGPDGSLFVIDMYRQHIETPLSIPEDLKQDMDFLAGSDMGRIYRVLPSDHNAPRLDQPKLNAMSTDQLVGLLAHSNRWWRLHAQRLLLERQDPSVTGAVVLMASTHGDPRTRLHALYVLEGMNALNASLVGEALADAHEGVRKHALILAERYPELLPQILELTNDSSVHVVLQATLSAGQFNNERVVNALASVANRYSADPWIRTAILSSPAGTTLELLAAVKNLGYFDTNAPERTAFLEDFSYMVGARNAEGEVMQQLDFISAMLNNNAQWQVAAAAGLIKGLERNGNIAGEMKDKLKQLKIKSGPEAMKAIAELRRFYLKA